MYVIHIVTVELICTYSSRMFSLSFSMFFRISIGGGSNELQFVAVICFAHGQNIWKFFKRTTLACDTFRYYVCCCDWFIQLPSAMLFMHVPENPLTYLRSNTYFPNRTKYKCKDSILFKGIVPVNGYTQNTQHNDCVDVDWLSPYNRLISFGLNFAALLCGSVAADCCWLFRHFYGCGDGRLYIFGICAIDQVTQSGQSRLQFSFATSKTPGARSIPWPRK